MRTRRPLPAILRDVPFTVSAALAVGVSRSRLRRSDLAAPHRGVRMPACSDGDGDVDVDVDLASRCRALAVALSPEACFSHTTAAALLGIPLPGSFDRDARMHVSVVHPSTPPAIRGVVTHEYRSHVRVVMLTNGLAVSDPVTTWTMLAQVLGVADLVAAGDYLVGGRSPLTTISALQSAVGALSGARGVRRMREALPQIRVGVRSRRETHARLLVIAAGLPEPELNVELFDAAGGFVAMVDIAWRRPRVGLEYEGRHHQEVGQFRKDVARRERVEDIGWRLTRATSDDLTTRVPEFITRLGLRLTHPVDASGIARAVALARTFGR